MATTLIGLDGIERDLKAATSLECGEEHGLGTISGYMLRKSSLTGGAHEDSAQFEGADSFGEALDAKALLLDACGYGAKGSYAIIDCTYECGCRGLG